MYERNRVSRILQKLSKRPKADQSPLKEPRSSELAQAESSGGAEQAQRVVRDQHVHGAQSVPAAISAPQSATPSSLGVNGSEASAIDLSEVAASAGAPKTASSRATPGGHSLTPSSSSSQSQLVANPGRPQTPISQSRRATTKVQNPTSTPDPFCQQAADTQELPGAKSASSETAKTACETVEFLLAQPRHGPLPAALTRQKDPAPKEEPERWGGSENSRGLRMAGLSDNEPSRDSLTSPTPDDEARLGGRCDGWSTEIRSEVFQCLIQHTAQSEIRLKTGVPLGTIQRWKEQWSLDTEPVRPTHRRSLSGASRQRRSAVALPVIKEGLPYPSKFAIQPQETAWGLETRSRVCNLLAEGMSVQEINKKTGVPVFTIFRWWDESGGRWRPL